MFPNQNLADGFASDRGFDRILDVTDIDAEAVCGGAIHYQIDVGLATHLKGAEVGDSGDLAHHVLHLFSFLLQGLEIAAEELDGQFAFDSADRFFHVVGNGLGEIPVHAGKLAKRLVHGGDQVIFGGKLLAPLGARQEVDKKFRVVETAGIAAVVGPANLTDYLLDFRKIC